MLRVILVDDNFGFIKTVFNLLSSDKIKNIKIEKIFSDGKSALNYILNKPVDVVLLDLNIPGLNGLEVIEELHLNNKKVDIITITGDADLVLKLRKENYTVYRNLIKPFDPKELINILNEINDKNSSYIRKDIIRLLDNFCFNKSSIGYLYLIECIEFCINHKHRIMPFTKIAYLPIAQLYDCDDYLKIGWNIDKAIKAMDKTTKIEVKQKFLKYNVSPSTKIFINCMLNVLYNS